MTRLLVDFHHNDLARSHQLLFGRFGVDVIFPYGIAWYDNWYWSFERATFGDAVARQYLEGIWGNAIPDDNGLVTAPNPHHPGTTITGITLEAARSQSWEFVMASVPANAPGFRTFARETGATYLLHVGNQWGNEEAFATGPDAAIVTTTSYVPIPHVVVHQEFDLGIFHPAPPVGFGPVSSFVNCFPENTDCSHLPGRGEYGIFTDLAASAPEFDWNVYGAYGSAPVDRWAAGSIESAAEIADRMRASSVGYHTKHWSDGFGHVIHDWFAVGRPVLGHARFYADKLAGPLWIEGVTSFDIEGKHRDDVIAILARLRADPDYHARLCENAATRFREVVDFDHDADLVADLLGLRVFA